MKDKGFTLIELLGAVTLIAIIAILSFPPILNQIRKVKEDLSDSMKEIIYGATNIYLETYDKNFLRINGNTYCIKIKDLVDSKFIKEPILDPVTNKSIDLDKKIEIKVQNKGYAVNFNEGCVVNVSFIKIPYERMDVETDTTLTMPKVIAIYEDNTNEELVPVIKKNNNVVSEINTSEIGTYELIYTATDAIRNITDTKIITINVVGEDKPKVEFALIGNPFNANGWSKTNINVSVTIRDNGVGPKNFKYCVTNDDICIPWTIVNLSTSPVTLDVEGTSSKICVSGYDMLDVQSDITCSENYQIDKTGPVFSGIDDTTIIGKEVNIENGVTASDKLSGIDGTYTYSPNSISSITAGNKVITYTAIDKAGNTTINSRNINVIVNKDSLIGETVTTGDGLYFDSLDNTYRYKGLEPNNYIRLFDGENGLFRIIAIEDQGIKVISNTLTRQLWDHGQVIATGCTDETCPRYNANNTYCQLALYNNPNDGNIYYQGCNAWSSVAGEYTNGSKTGTVSEDSIMLQYLHSYYEDNLEENSNNIVQNAKWNIGGVSSTTLANIFSEESVNSWQGNIGLMNVSDYVRSQLPSANESCITSIFDNTECKNSNWMYYNGHQWTINARKNYSNHVNYIMSDGKIASYTAHGSTWEHARPIVYLTSTIQFSNGMGTSTDPYVLRTTSADELIDDAVTSGDGLYLDDLDNTYRYKGTNPNNYIRLFGGDKGLYRIIAIENQGIKVISNDLDGTLEQWDKGYAGISECTETNCPRYNDNNTYCKQALTGGTYYVGCNVWYAIGSHYTNAGKTGSVNEDSSMLKYLRDDYYENNLKILNNEIVQSASYNIGNVSDVENKPMSSLLSEEQSINWNGKIGLMNISDYVRGQLPTSNSECISNPVRSTTCKNNNWLLNTSNNTWTINPLTTMVRTWYISSGGSITHWDAGSNRGKTSRPVVYLSPNIEFDGGDGTYSNPYTIKTTAIDSLISSTVTTGDGLYLDPLDNTYRFKGANPDNYIRLFNGNAGLYRIIAIENQGIKIMSNQITLRVWDKGYVEPANCTNVTCPRYNSGSTYCDQAIRYNLYRGCNAWYDIGGTYTTGEVSGTVNAESTMLTYLRDTYYELNLRAFDNKIIKDAIWNIGGVHYTTLTQALDWENNYTWNGKIGLMNASDYVRSQLPSDNGACATQIGEVEACKTNNWIYDSTQYQWTINTNRSDTYHLFAVTPSGILNGQLAELSRGTRPVIYLSPTVEFNRGSGTISNPYILEN